VNLADVVYFVPLIPLLANAGLSLPFRAAARGLMPTAQQARESHRTVILALGGLSFAGFVGVVSLSESGAPE